MISVVIFVYVVDFYFLNSFLFFLIAYGCFCDC